MKEEHKNKIQQFLNNKLSREELDAFYKELEENEALLEALSVEVVKIHGRLELKKRLSDIERHVNQKKTIKFPLWFKIAASVIVLIGSVCLIMHMFSGDTDTNTKISSIDTTETKDKIVAEDKAGEKEQPGKLEKLDTSDDIKENPAYIAQKNTQQKIEETETTVSASQLATQFFEPYPKPQYRGSTIDIDDVFVFYEAEKYDTVISLLNQKMKTVTNDEAINTVLFYRGICLFNKGLQEDDKKLLASAKKSFAANYTDPKSKHKEEAGWYLALVYLSFENKDKATEILKDIVHNKTYNAEKACILLEKL